MAATVVFYVMAGVALLGAGILLGTRNVMYAAYGLMATLLGVAGIYVVLGADFVGTTQILVYAGGILVLMLFGVMLTHRMTGERLVSRSHNRWAGGLLAALCLGGLVWAIVATPWQAPAPATATDANALETLGQSLMTDYLLAFEAVAVLLLVVLVGAAYIARLTAPKQP